MRTQVFRDVRWGGEFKGQYDILKHWETLTQQHSITHILEDMHPHQHHCKNVKSPKTEHLQKAVHGLPLYPQVVQIKLFYAKGLFHHMQNSVHCLVCQLDVTGSNLSEPSVVLQSTDYWHDIPEHNNHLHNSCTLAQNYT